MTENLSVKFVGFGITNFKMEISNNIETLFKTEPPIQPLDNGHGFLGVVLRNKITDTLQCHICGNWFESLSRHILAKHKITVENYREDYEIPTNFPLVSRRISGIHSISASRPENIDNLKKHRNPARAREFTPKKGSRKWKRIRRCLGRENMIGACPEQIIRRFMIVSDIVGREPSSDDLKKFDSPLIKIIVTRFKTINNFRKQNGFGIKKMNRPRGGYSDEFLISVIRKYHHKYGRIPKAREFLLQTPTTKTFLDHFGSWNRAITVAGFLPRHPYKHFKTGLVQTIFAEPE